MSVDVLGTSWDQCRSMAQYSFTSTETRRLVRTDSPGQPPRLSHSSWTILCFWRKYGALFGSRFDRNGGGYVDIITMMRFWRKYVAILGSRCDRKVSRVCLMFVRIEARRLSPQPSPETLSRGSSSLLQPTAYSVLHVVSCSVFFFFFF